MVTGSLRQEFCFNPHFFTRKLLNLKHGSSLVPRPTLFLWRPCHTTRRRIAGMGYWMTIRVCSNLDDMRIRSEPSFWGVSLTYQLHTLIAKSKLVVFKLCIFKQVNQKALLCAWPFFFSRLYLPRTKTKSWVSLCHSKVISMELRPPKSLS